MQHFQTGPTTFPQFCKWGSLGFERKRTRGRTAWLVDQMETKPSGEILGKGCQESSTYGVDSIPTWWFVINVWATCGAQLLHGSCHEPLCRAQKRLIYH